MPVREYVWSGTSWGGSSTPGPLSRDSLVPGTYIPGVTVVSGYPQGTVGLADPDAVTTVITGTNGKYEVSQANASFTNTRFACAVIIKPTATNASFTNCLFTGNIPDSITASRNTGGDLPAYAIQNFTSAHVTLTDCLIDGGWWYDQGESSMVSTQWGIGFWGGNFTYIRVESRRMTDQVNYNGAPSGAGQFVLIDSSWLHNNYYAQNIPTDSPYWQPQSGGYTHSDGFQFNTGPNVEIRYSYIGGPRLASERKDYPGDVTQDSANSAIMYQQEADSRYDATRRTITNVSIHDNWLAGGSATVNINYRQGNQLPAPDNQVVNNRIMRRLTGQNDSGFQILRTDYLVQEYDDNGTTKTTTTTGVTTDTTGNVEWDPNGSLYGTGVPTQIAHLTITTKLDGSTVKSYTYST